MWIVDINDVIERTLSKLEQYINKADLLDNFCCFYTSRLLLLFELVSIVGMTITNQLLISLVSFCKNTWKYYKLFWINIFDLITEIKIRLSSKNWVYTFLKFAGIHYNIYYSIRLRTTFLRIFSHVFKTSKVCQHVFCVLNSTE